MIASGFTSNLSMTSNSFSDLKSMGDTKAAWISPLSQHLIVTEATPEQRRVVEEELRPRGSAWPQIVNHEEVVLRKRYFREEIRHLRSNVKMLVMTPRRAPDTLDEIYCTVIMRRLSCLLLQNGEVSKSYAFYVHGVYVIEKLRLQGYATAMIQRIMGRGVYADLNTIPDAELAEWLQAAKSGISYTGAYAPGTPAGSLWTKYGHGLVQYDMSCKFVDGQTLPIPDRYTTCRWLNVEDVADTLAHHNELQESNWRAKHTGAPANEVLVKALPGYNDFLCRVEYSRWLSNRKGTTLPAYWGLEIGTRGKPDWGYLVLDHRLEDRKIKVFSYHIPNAEATQALIRHVYFWTGL